MLPEGHGKIVRPRQLLVISSDPRLEEKISLIPKDSRGFPDVEGPDFIAEPGHKVEEKEGLIQVFERATQPYDGPASCECFLPVGVRVSRSDVAPQCPKQGLGLPFQVEWPLPAGSRRRLERISFAMEVPQDLLSAGEGTTGAVREHGVIPGWMESCLHHAGAAQETPNTGSPFVGRILGHGLALWTVPKARKRTARFETELDPFRQYASARALLRQPGGRA